MGLPLFSFVAVTGRSTPCSSLPQHLLPFPLFSLLLAHTWSTANALCHHQQTIPFHGIRRQVRAVGSQLAVTVFSSQLIASLLSYSPLLPALSHKSQYLAINFAAQLCQPELFGYVRVFFFFVLFFCPWSLLSSSLSQSLLSIKHVLTLRFSIASRSDGCGRLRQRSVYVHLLCRRHSTQPAAPQNHEKEVTIVVRAWVVSSLPRLYQGPPDFFLLFVRGWPVTKALASRIPAVSLSRRRPTACTRAFLHLLPRQCPLLLPLRRQQRRHVSQLASRLVVPGVARPELFSSSTPYTTAMLPPAPPPREPPPAPQRVRVRGGWSPLCCCRNFFFFPLML